MKNLLLIFGLLLLINPAYAEIFPNTTFQEDLDLIRLGKKISCSKLNIDKTKCVEYINYETNLLILDELRKLNSRTDIIMNNSIK